MGSSIISLGLGLGGGKAGTSSGSPGGGGAWNNDYSLSLDGTNNYMNVGNVSALNFERTDAFSVSGWVKRSGSGATQVISSKATNASPYTGYSFYINTSDQIASNINVSFSSNYLSVSGNTTLNTSWNHVCVTYDGSSNASGIKLYVNGNAETTGSAGQTSISGTLSNSYPVNIGSRNNGDLYFNGLIDEVAIFNSALTASNVTAIYNSGTPVNLGTGGLNLSPVGWWRMGDNDSGTGTTVTDQGSGSNDGTLANGPTFSPEVPYVLPAITNDYSVSFDGTDDYMDVPDSTALETTAFTWSAWFYCTTINRHNTIVDASTSASLFNGYHIRVNTTNKIRFTSYHAGDAIDSTTLVSADTWYHVAATHESGSDKLYVNGVLEVSGSAGSFGTTDAVNLTIGSSTVLGGLYHEGLIDEVSFFNSALTATDISAIYNRGTPADLTSLSPVGWWRMGDGTGDTDSGGGAPANGDAIGTVVDQGSGGNNAVGSGGPTYSSTTP